jgi:hypothetical protein
VVFSEIQPGLDVIGNVVEGNATKGRRVEAASDGKQ